MLSERLWNSHFAVVLGEGGSGGGWTFWGAGDLQEFEGEHADASFDGDLRSLYLGIDGQVDEAWRAGLAASQVWGRQQWSSGDLSGELDSELSVLYPYLRGRLGGQGEVWALAGLGRGDLEHQRWHVGGLTDRGDLDARLGLLGGRRLVAHSAGISWSVLGDIGASSLKVDSGERSLRGLDASVSRVRVGVEAGFGDGEATHGFVRLSGRSDGGDGVTGEGAETAGGLVWSGGRLDARVQGRWLLAHSASGYEDRSVSLSLDRRARADGKGLAWHLASGWGMSGSGFGGSGLGGAMGRGELALLDDRHSLLDRGHELSAGEASANIEGRMSYGFGLRRGRLLRPFAGWRQEHSRSKLQMGIELEGPWQWQLVVTRTQAAEPGTSFGRDTYEDGRRRVDDVELGVGLTLRYVFGDSTRRRMGGGATAPMPDGRLERHPGQATHIEPNQVPE